MNAVTLPLVLATLLPLRTPRAQEAEGPPVLGLSEIVLDQYHVQHVDPGELYELAVKLVGREYYVRERGGPRSEPVSSLRLLGDTIVLYDRKDEVQRARDLIFELDAPPPTADSGWTALEYRPRFVSLDTCQAAVQNLVKASRVEERGLLVLQGSAQANEMAVGLLKRIDVPAKQVLLTCLLVEAGSAQSGPAMPKELLDNLQKLLPQSQFVQTGLGMLKTSVGGQTPISVRIETEDRSYRLSFVPVAFDEGSGSLTVVDCFMLDESTHANVRELFRTSTVLRGGEYTVLAATGRTSELLVLRVTPQ
jgi:hypothetical protein